MNWKQFWCDHIWKGESKQSLGMFTSYLAGVPLHDFEKFAIYQYCLKCGKKRIIEVNGEKKINFDG